MTPAQVAELRADRDRYRDTLERLADPDTPVLGAGIGGGPAEELHVRASLAAQALGQPACDCSDCTASLSPDGEP